MRFRGLRIAVVLHRIFQRNAWAAICSAQNQEMGGVQWMNRLPEIQEDRYEKKPGKIARLLLQIQFENQRTFE